MSMFARKFDVDPQQDRDAGLELLTTSDFYAAASVRYQPVRDRRSAARDQGAGRAQPLAR